MTKEELKTKFDGLYAYMAMSKEPKYMMLYGVAELIYGAHNRDQARTLKSERKAIAKKASAKSVKAAPKKTVKKATSSRTSVKMKATTRRKK